MSIKVYKATLENKKLLIQLRLDFLKAEFGQLSIEDELTIQNQFDAFLEKNIPSHGFIGIIAEYNSETASAAFLVINEKPAGPTFLNGITGTLLNVWTYPEFRRKGIAKKVVETLIDYAKEAKVSLIDLFATLDGMALYEKLHFKIPEYQPMRLKLIDNKNT